MREAEETYQQGEAQEGLRLLATTAALVENEVENEDEDEGEDDDDDEDEDEGANIFVLREPAESRGRHRDNDGRLSKKRRFAIYDTDDETDSDEDNKE